MTILYHELTLVTAKKKLKHYHLPLNSLMYTLIASLLFDKSCLIIEITSLGELIHNYSIIRKFRVQNFQLIDIFTLDNSFDISNDLLSNKTKKNSAT